MPLKLLWNFLASLRLTVVCLLLALVLVFAGTIAQVHVGLYQAQAQYFKSFLVWWSPPGAGWRIPVYPGGYLIGGVLVLNLIAGHLKRFGFARKKLGLFLIHAGLILLLLGQLLTDLLSTESSMRLAEGETAQYSEDFQKAELVLIDKSDPRNDRVYSIPDKRLARQTEFPLNPLTLRVKQYWPNAGLFKEAAPGAVPTGATRDVGQGLFLTGKPPTTKMNERNLPAALVEVVTPQGPLGSWFVSSLLAQPQTFTAGGKSYEIGLRFLRYYKPFRITLLKFSHDKYQGTEKARNFSSRVRLQNPATREDREVLIYMNNPLRYQGETFYQSGFLETDQPTTILQVVRNPSWLTPYLSCALVGLGLAVQFLTHLFGFIKRKAA